MGEDHVIEVESQEPAIRRPEAALLTSIWMLGCTSVQWNTPGRTSRMGTAPE
jgi:hypothetical protein